MLPFHQFLWKSVVWFLCNPANNDENITFLAEVTAANRSMLIIAHSPVWTWRAYMYSDTFSPCVLPASPSKTIGSLPKETAWRSVLCRNVGYLLTRSYHKLANCHVTLSSIFVVFAWLIQCVMNVVQVRGITVQLDVNPITCHRNSCANITVIRFISEQRPHKRDQHIRRGMRTVRQRWRRCSRSTEARRRPWSDVEVPRSTCPRSTSLGSESRREKPAPSWTSPVSAACRPFVWTTPARQPHSSQLS